MNPRRSLLTLAAAATVAFQIGAQTPRPFDPGEHVFQTAQKLAVAPHLTIDRPQEKRGGHQAVAVRFRSKVGFDLSDLVRFLAKVEATGRAQVTMADFGERDRDSGVWRPRHLEVIARGPEEAQTPTPVSRLKLFLEAFEAAARKGRGHLDRLALKSGELEWTMRGDWKLWARLVTELGGTAGTGQLRRGHLFLRDGETLFRGCRMAFGSDSRSPASNDDSGLSVLEVAQELGIAAKIRIMPSLVRKTAAGVETRTPVNFAHKEGYRFADLMRLASLVEAKTGGRITRFHLGARDEGSDVWRPRMLTVQQWTPTQKAPPVKPGDAVKGVANHGSALQRLDALMKALADNAEHIGAYRVTRLRVDPDAVRWSIETEAAQLGRLEPAFAKMEGFDRFVRGVLQVSAGKITYSGCELRFHPR